MDTESQLVEQVKNTKFETIYFLNSKDCVGFSGKDLYWLGITTNGWNMFGNGSTLLENS